MVHKKQCKSCSDFYYIDVDENGMILNSSICSCRRRKHHNDSYEVYINQLEEKNKNLILRNIELEAQIVALGGTVKKEKTRRRKLIV